ncbi:MAG: surface lipoprotein assembly modifier [Pseudomonadota bacterium]
MSPGAALASDGGEPVPCAEASVASRSICAGETEAVTAQPSAGPVVSDAAIPVVSDAAIVALIARDAIAEARALYARTGPDEADWMFFEGRVAKASGQLDKAQTAFREALRLNPAHLSAKRELAHTLLIAEDYSGAEHHFRELLQADPEAEYRQGYVRFLRQIDRLRPFSINGHLALVSSSNVNRGSSETEFVPGVPGVPRFDITSRAQDGQGVEAGLAGRIQHTTAKDRQLTFDWGIFGRKFDHDQHDSLTVSARLRFGQLQSKSQWSVGPLVRANVNADGNDAVSVGLAANYERRVARRLNVFASGIYQYRHSLDKEGIDAPFTTLQAGIARPFRNGSVAIGPRFVFFRPEEEHQRYAGQSVFARLSRSWSGGLSGGLGIEVGRRGYADDFPLAGEPREDKFYQITFTAQHDQFRLGRFIPTINCILGSTDSNIAFFKHSVEECTLGVSTRL